MNQTLPVSIHTPWGLLLNHKHKMYVTIFIQYFLCRLSLFGWKFCWMSFGKEAKNRKQSFRNLFLSEWIVHIVWFYCAVRQNLLSLLGWTGKQSSCVAVWWPSDSQHTNHTLSNRLDPARLPINFQLKKLIECCPPTIISIVSILCASAKYRQVYFWLWKSSLLYSSLSSTWLSSAHKKNLSLKIIIECGW